MLAVPAIAEERALRNNWNTDACGLTDTAVMHLEWPTHVHHVELWYNWLGDQRHVPYKLFHEGRLIREGAFKRGSCDANQPSWCVASEHLDAHLHSGRYTFKVEGGRVCQNSGSRGMGFIKIYGKER
jgi:hypothetical protein